MKQPKSQKEGETLKTEETKKPSEKISIPIFATAEDIVRALGILADKGGNARFKEMAGMFGPKKSDNNLLSSSLNAGAAFELIKPHRGRAPYIISSFGTKFLTATEEQKKMMLLPKFLGFRRYRNILVQMKNEPNNSLKKEVITNAWLNVVRGSKLGTRKRYTQTFASVGKWCGAMEDTGQTCSLAEQGLEIFSQILKGEEVKEVKPTRPTAPTRGVPTKPTGLSFQVTHCPHCGKAEFSIENEELLNTLTANGTNTLVIKYTFYCRGCSRSFSRIGQQTIRAD